MFGSALFGANRLEWLFGQLVSLGVSVFCIDLSGSLPLLAGIAVLIALTLSAFRLVASYDLDAVVTFTDPQFVDQAAWEVR